MLSQKIAFKSDRKCIKFTDKFYFTVNTMYVNIYIRKYIHRMMGSHLTHFKQSQLKYVKIRPINVSKYAFIIHKAYFFKALHQADDYHLNQQTDSSFFGKHMLLQILINNRNFIIIIIIKKGKSHTTQNKILKKKKIVRKHTVS